MSNWYASRIRTVSGFPKAGVQFRDITTLLADPEGIKRVVDDLVGRYKGVQIDKVAGIDARGFILGGAVAYQLETAFVPLRKPGKLPAQRHRMPFEKEYGSDSLEVHVDAISSGDLVLIVDDLIATGGSAEAAVKLVQAAGGRVAAACFVVDLPYLGGAQKIRDMGVDVVTLCEFGKD